MDSDTPNSSDQCHVTAATSGDHTSIVTWLHSQALEMKPRVLMSIWDADRDGLFIARTGDRILGMASACHWRDRELGVFAYFYVSKKHRGKGVGRSLWKRSMDYLSDVNISVAVSEHLTDYYKDKGFDIEGPQVYQLIGVPTRACVYVYDDYDVTVYKLDTLDDNDVILSEVYNYDVTISSSNRKSYLSNWLRAYDNSYLVVVKDMTTNSIHGYAVVQATFTQEVVYHILTYNGGGTSACSDGTVYRIEPLYADSMNVFHLLINRILDTLPVGAPISIDAPSTNMAAVDYFRRARQLQSRDRLQVLYNRDDVTVDWKRVYGRTFALV